MSREAMKLALEAAEVLEKLFKQAEAMNEDMAAGVNVHCQITVADLSKGLYAAPVIREALAEQSAKEKAPQSANCEAPGWINSDHARRDDCTTEQPAQHRAWFTVDELNAWADKKLKENPQWEEKPAQVDPCIDGSCSCCWANLDEQSAQQGAVAVGSLEALLGRYWDLAYLEGKSGISQGDKANEVLFAIRKLAGKPSQQEPVVFYRCNGCGHAYEQVHPTSCDCMEDGGFDRVEYYTSPPAQQGQVAWTLLLTGEHHGLVGKSGEKFVGAPDYYERVDVYTFPQRKWVGLTEEDENKLLEAVIGSLPIAKNLIRAIEANLREKNT